jgi:hypothetical protein
VKKKTAKSKTVTPAPVPAVAGVPSPMFVRGQVWQFPHGIATILHVGKRLVEYKFLKTGMVRGPIEMNSISNFTESMKNHKAKLIG